MTHWYALHTKPHKEKSVAHLIEDRGIPTFLPMMSSTLINKQKRMIPIFRGYVFASIDLDEGNTAIWRWTPGLRYIVAYGDDPIPIPDEVIRMIAAKIEDLNIRASTHQHGFMPGDMVRIKNGPFKDMLAIFDGPTTPSERVQVLLTAMRRSVRVRTDVDSLEKVSSHGSQPSARRPRRTRGRGRPIS